MKKITFLLFIIFTTLLTAKSNYKLLIVDSQEGEPYKSVRESLLKELGRLGFEEGKNLKIQYYSLGNYEGAATSIFKKEKDTSYDVIFVNGTSATKAFKDLAYNNEKYNFVFASVTDPVGLGVIKNFNEAPQANFTGVCYPVKIKERLRFIKKVMPNAKKIGFIYADMPQSISYLKWLDEELKKEEFQDLEFMFRKVDFVKGENGHKRMAMLAKKHILDLSGDVDLFVSPNDQLGVQEDFAKILVTTTKKPLLGLGKKDVMENWGATFSIYPSLDGAGKQSANMIAKIFNGKSIKEIIPEWPNVGYTFDLGKAKEKNISIPKDLMKEAGKNIVD